MPDADRIRVRLFLWTNTTGTFWFDDFSLDQGLPARYPFQDGFPVAASGSIFFCSPAVADVDGDGDNELLVGGGNRVDGWDDTGAWLPGFPLATGDRHIVGHRALADLDGDRDLEIVAGTRTPVANGQGRVFVWHHTGTLLGGWPKSVAWEPQYSHNDSRVTSVVLADIDGDDDCRGPRPTCMPGMPMEPWLLECGLPGTQSLVSMALSPPATSAGMGLPM